MTRLEPLDTQALTAISLRLNTADITDSYINTVHAYTEYH